MCQVCMFFAHEALSHLMVRYLTAGRDSTVVMTASFHISLLVENIYNEYQTLFNCSFPKRIHQLVEELILQPDQHHRVVFMQPPSSLDDGLENQSVKFFFFFFVFYLPYKGTDVFNFNIVGETSRALFVFDIK